MRGVPQSSRLWAILMSVTVLFSPAAIAQESPGQTPAPAPIDLDLTSTEATHSAAHLLQDQQVNITVGSTVTPVSSSTLLTPAQMVAVYQVVKTGQQSLLLGELGNAVGGSFNLGPRFAQRLSELVIPEGVTALGNTGAAGILNLAGNLVNSGAFYTFSNNLNVGSLTFQADNITNQISGLISSVLPVGGLTGVGNVASGVNLNLVAVNQIMNAGQITSAGNLSMTAQSLVNSGLIQSTAGNVSAFGTGSNFVVNNIGGTISALNGNVNMATLIGQANLSLLGGLTQAQEINFKAAQGKIDIAADVLEGLVNVKASDLIMSVNSGNLSLQTIDLSGDPTFTVGGDFIVLNGDAQGTVFVGDDFVVNAGGNIIIEKAISTAAATVDANNGLGSNVRLTAGGDILLSGVNGSGVTIDTSGVNGAGFIILSAGGEIQIAGDLKAESSTGNGAQITVLANNDITIGNGLGVDVSNAAVTWTQAIDIQSNSGSVNIAGGIGSNLSNATPFVATDKVLINAEQDINLGYVSTNIQSTCCGSSSPVPNSQSVLIHSKNGDVTIGTDLGGNSIDTSGLAGGSITVAADEGSITIAGGVSSVGSVSNGSGDGDGGAVVMRSASGMTVGSITTTGIDVGGDVELYANDPSASNPGAFLTTADITSSAGTRAGRISLFADGAITTGALIAAGTDSNSFGGMVTILSGDSVVVNGIDTSAESGTGGNILGFSAQSFTSNADVSSSTGSGADDTQTSGHIIVVAGQDITLPDVYTAAVQTAAPVALVAGGNIAVTEIDTDSDGTAGSIYVSAFGGINITEIEADGGTTSGDIIVTNAQESGSSGAGITVGSQSGESYIELTGDLGSSVVLSRNLDITGAGSGFTPETLPGGGFTELVSDSSSSIALLDGAEGNFRNMIVPIVLQAGATGTFDLDSLTGLGSDQDLYLFSMGDIAFTGTIENSSTAGAFAKVTMASMMNVSILSPTINTGSDGVTLIHGGMRYKSTLGTNAATATLTIGSAPIISLGGNLFNAGILESGFDVGATDMILNGSAGPIIHLFDTDSLMRITVDTLTFNGAGGTTNLNFVRHGLFWDLTTRDRMIPYAFRTTVDGDIDFTGTGTFNITTNGGIYFGSTTGGVDFGTQNIVMETSYGGIQFETGNGVVNDPAGSLNFTINTNRLGSTFDNTVRMNAGFAAGGDGDVTVYNVTSNANIEVTMLTGAVSELRNFNISGFLHVDYQAVSLPGIPTVLTLDELNVGTLKVFTLDGRLVVKNNITSGNSMFLIAGENWLESLPGFSGAIATNPDLLEIIVEPGATITQGSNGTVNIVVANALFVDPGHNYITIGAAGGPTTTIFDNGCFNCIGNPAAMGGGVDIVVIPGASWERNTNNDNSGVKIYNTVNAQRTSETDWSPLIPEGTGYVSINGVMDDHSDSLSKQFTGFASDGLATLTADGNGLVRINDAGVPGSVIISGNSTLWANGGVVNVDSGDAFFGEISIFNTNITAFLPFTAGPPLAVPPGGGGGGGVVVVLPPVPGVPPPVVVVVAPPPGCVGCTVVSIEKTPPPQPTVVLPVMQAPILLNLQPATYVASTDCEQYYLKLNQNKAADNGMRGQAGTEFEVTQEKTILLKDGRMLVGAGSEGMTMQVAGEMVTMKPDTVALIESRANKPMRVTVINGNHEDAVTVSKDNQEVARVSKGQEAIIADSPLADEELIPTDGVERQPIGGTIVKQGLQVKKNTLSVAELEEKDPFLAACRKKKEKERLGNVSLNTGSHQAEIAKSNDLMPIAYWHGNLDQSNAYEISSNVPMQPGKYQFNGDGDWKLVAFTPMAANIRLGKGSRIEETGNNSYRLVSGTALIEAADEMTVQLGNASIHLTKGATVAVYTDGTTSGVQDLCDLGVGKVFFVADKKYLSLRPGQEAVLTVGPSTGVGHKIAADQLGRRRMKVVPIQEATHLVTSEFSLVDHMNKNHLLKGLRSSPEKHDQKLMNSILKSAAALSLTVDRSHGPYSGLFKQ